jgi:predicted GNAT superfamily acetyltransferase
VGFVFTNPGLTDAGAIKQCSILMAIDPAYQNGGIGYRLKLAQREAALAQGIDLITWTFDPLASLNARLNLQKLGCVSRRYLVDIYGTVEQGLNGGLPTDRLLVEWWIREPAVLDRLARVPVEPPVAAPIINQVVPDPVTDLPVLQDADLDRSEPALLLEIPESIRAVKLMDMGLARNWRYGLRQILQHYFDRGYQAAAFHRLPYGGRVRQCFLLERD